MRPTSKSASVRRGATPAIPSPWAETTDRVLERLGVAPDLGLTSVEVDRRRQRWGSNVLEAARPARPIDILAHQFRSLIVALLGVAMIVALAFGDFVEAAAIGVVLLLNAAIGFVAELRAVRSMEALRRLGQIETRVRRDGRELEVPAEDLVPGDIVLIEDGNVVTADMRLLDASRLQVDESALTGESVPVEKSVDPVDREAPLAERLSMLFKATAVPSGSGLAVVTATGMATELGRIARLVEAAEDEVTPLEQRLERLGRRLIWLTLIVVVVTGAAGIAAGRDVFLMIETAIALAVAAVPEGLPVVATIALARGMWRMAQRRALINRLAAVETLGATTLILTDKTGTLTENRMTAQRFELATGSFSAEDSKAANEDLRRLVEAGVLCNNAALGAAGDEPAESTAGVGDPLELALLAAGRAFGVERAALLDQRPEVREEAFDSGRRLMATIHRAPSGAGFQVAIKGAAESVLEISTAVVESGRARPLDDADRAAWLERNQELARSGFRVLGLAENTVPADSADPYAGASFLGLVALEDPARNDVAPALEACRAAGVRVVMVTGDQPATAGAVAEAVGLIESAQRATVVKGADLGPLETLPLSRRAELLEVPIFARVDPSQKLEIITLHQEAGEVVAMTGDGVNDAPALKKADIGVAMGRRGTQVAKEASDMVLEDDSFSSIVAAIEQGRIIFGNIRKFVFYLMSCNLSEVMAVGLASVLSVPLPILPLQILFLNLVTDVFPALALALGEGERDAMKRPPRPPDESILTARHWRAIALYGALITVSVMAALGLALRWLELSPARAVTVSFTTLALAQLWHAFNMRDHGSSFAGNEIVRNPWIWGALAASTALVLAAVLWPPLASVLELENPGPAGWYLALGSSLVPWAVGQAWHAVER